MLLMMVTQYMHLNHIGELMDNLLSKNTEDDQAPTQCQLDRDMRTLQSLSRRFLHKSQEDSIPTQSTVEHNLWPLEGFPFPAWPFQGKGRNPTLGVEVRTS